MRVPSHDTADVTINTTFFPVGLVSILMMGGGMGLLAMRTGPQNLFAAGDTLSIDVLPQADQDYWLSGALLGMIGGLSWVASAVRHPWTRFLIRATVVGLGACWMDWVSYNSFASHLALAGGVVFFQSLIFWAVGFPGWQFASTTSNRAEASPRRRQFGISELVISATTAAVLFAVMKLYVVDDHGRTDETPVATFARYWSVSWLIWVLVPLISTGVLSLVRSDLGFGARGGIWVGAIMLALVMAVFLTVAQYGFDLSEIWVFQGNEGSQDNWVFRRDGFRQYVRVLMGLVTTVHGFALMAWLSNRQRARGQQVQSA